MLNLAKRKKLNTLHSISEIRNKTFIKKNNNFHKVPKNKKNKKFFLNGSIYVFNNVFKKTNSIKEIKGNYFFQKKYSLDLDSLNDLKKFNLFYFFNKKKIFGNR